MGRRTAAAFVAALPAWLAFGPHASPQGTADQQLLVSAERIWDRAAHSAFTDLIEFQGSLFCTFREGSGHIPGFNGTIRILRSDDRVHWRSVALLDEPHVDLRDPKLSVAPDGRLMLSTGASYYQGGRRVGIESRTAFSDPTGENFSPPRKVALPDRVRTGFDWLWRVVWRDGVAWGCVQQAPDDGPRRLWLVRSGDGVRFDPVAELDVGVPPTETTLRFLPDGTMLAMIRSVERTEPGRIGRAPPPYTDWKFQKSNQAFGGPNFVQLPGGDWLAGGRDQNAAPHRTRLWSLDLDRAILRPRITLPSDGDNSYPGFVVDEDRRRIYVSYYSSHEGKAAVYLATLRLDAWLAYEG